jgi:hypothetical protein
MGMSISVLLFALMALVTAGVGFLLLKQELQLRLIPEYSRGATSLKPQSVNWLFGIALGAALGIVSLVPL